MKGTCLLTGGGGFVGRWLASALGEAGYGVRSFDNRSTGAENEVIGDLLDRAALALACDGVESICHLVALQSSRDHGWDEFYELNVRGTDLLLETAVAHGIKRFVFFSTELVYGRQPGEVVREDAPLLPRGHYGKTKKLAEEVCQRYQEENDIELTILRPCNIMGPGKTRVIEELFGRIADNRIVPLIGNPNKAWQVVDVRDVSRLTCMILDKEVTGVYNVGTLSPPSTADVYGSLIAHAGSTSRIFSLPGTLVKLGCTLLDPVGLSPLTADQYGRLTDNWIVDPSPLLERLHYTLQHDEIASMTATYDAYIETRTNTPR